MENKTTTELLDLFKKLTDESGNIKDADKYNAVEKELKERTPFLEILNEDWDESLPAVWNIIRDLQEEIKKLKRHKHDEKTGDVLVRI